jgi:hypothetical protein
MLDAPSVDDRHFPLVFISYPVSLTGAGFDSILPHLDRLYGRGRLAIVADINPIVTAPATLRAHVARQVDGLTSRHPRTCLAEAVVARSPFVRGVFTAYSWLKADKSYPSRAFPALKDAYLWAAEVLRGNGVFVPGDAPSWAI